MILEPEEVTAYTVYARNLRVGDAICHPPAVAEMLLKVLTQLKALDDTWKAMPYDSYRRFEAGVEKRLA